MLSCSGYMAPETVCDAKSSKITPKSDIYSLGVLILEIVTGEKCPDNEYSGQRYIEKVKPFTKYVCATVHRLSTFAKHYCHLACYSFILNYLYSVTHILYISSCYHLNLEPLYMMYS